MVGLADVHFAAGSSGATDAVSVAYRIDRYPLRRRSLAVFTARFRQYLLIRGVLFERAVAYVASSNR